MTEYGALFDPSHITRVTQIEDPELLNEIFDLYIHSINQMDLIVSAFSEVDKESLRISTHRLKSSSELVGALKLAECLKELESSIYKNHIDLSEQLDATRLTLRQTKTAIQNSFKPPEAP